MTHQEFLFKAKMDEWRQQQAYNNDFAGLGMGGIFGSARQCGKTAMGEQFVRMAQERARAAPAQQKPKPDASVIHLTKQPDGSYSVPLTLTQEVP